MEGREKKRIGGRRKRKEGRTQGEVSEKKLIDYLERNAGTLSDASEFFGAGVRIHATAICNHLE